jgi:TRAP-type uncharacterized transport system fused permease subunit
MDVMSCFLLMALAVPVTAALCQFRLAHNLRISYGTVVTGAFIVALIFFVFLFPSQFSYNSHHDPHHKWDPNWFPYLVKWSAFIAVICLLPALAVVAYYQMRRSEIQTIKGAAPEMPNGQSWGI